MMLLRAYSRPSVIKQNVVNELETEIEEERRYRGWFGTIT